MHNNIDAALRGERLRKMLGVALCLAFFAALIAELLVLRREGGLVLRGDFPAFYSAAVILERGDGARLYDYDLQRNVQNEFFPALDGEMLAFAYPPYVAQLLQPLAWFGPHAAKAVIGLFLFALAGATLWCAALLSPWVRANLWFSAGLALSFPPLAIGIVAAQNISWTLFCLFAAWVNACRRRSAVVTGLLLGGLFLKPQYALLVAAFLFVGRRFRELAGMAVMAFFFWSVAAMQFGPSWTGRWLIEAEEFVSLDAVANASSLVSVLGISRAVFPQAGLAIGGFLALSLGLVLAWRTALRVDAHWDAFFLLLGPALVLLAPNTLFYDVPLALLPLLVAFPPVSPARLGVALGVVFAALCIEIFQAPRMLNVFFALGALLPSLRPRISTPARFTQ